VPRHEPITIGSRLGPYEILGAIGRGGMGEVYRARDPRLARAVAVKVLPADAGDLPDRLPRFEREAQAVAALNHPNILALHDIRAHSFALQSRHRTQKPQNPQSLI
jgi:serine/threonine protein kinase